jgi:hypothetical protein
LEKAEKENKEFTNKVKDANDILSLLKSNIALLKRDIRRYYYKRVIDRLEYEY